MPSEISDSKFADLKVKLRELFELDKSDLDFGIYRIIAAKNKEVTEFLDRQLKDVVRQILAAHGAGAAEQVQAELDRAIQQAQSLGADPDSLPKVRELKAKLAAAGGAAAAELEADIYNHLLAFFGRYYDEGDFISKRRYKGDVYSIPYGGEEVTLHWANKDQYYIKSGEWHKDYRFKLGGKTVHFKLVEATQEPNDTKEPDDAKRRYILDAKTPIEATETELTLRFQFRVPKEADKQAVAEATRIFGGKFAANSGRTKGDEREQFCADSEQRVLAAMPDSWKPVITTLSATDTKPARTILGKHLDYFTARNTFDYFIHKDLGGFLKRELDFYIKNEVVRLDDLEALPGDHLARVQGKIKAIRAVAGRIIEFLASIEDFQKKMWLKKKLVLETNWLVTIDRIPAKLRDVVAANAEQWAEWERLGFKPEAEPGLLISEGHTGAHWGTREYLDANDKLVVDTWFFNTDFKTDVLSSETVLAGQQACDDAILGLLIHADNLPALSLIRDRHQGEFKFAYNDPPYNTGDDGFPYKDSLRHATWMTMITQVARACMPVLRNPSLVYFSIDRDENRNLLPLLFQELGEQNFVEEIIWQKAYGGGSKTKLVNNLHEYIIAFSKSKDDLPKLWLPPDEDAARYYRFKDEKFATRGKYRSQPLYTNSNDYRENLTYPLPIPTDAKPGSQKWKEELDVIGKKLADGSLTVSQRVGGAWSIEEIVEGARCEWQGACVSPPKQWQWSWEKARDAYINDELLFTYDQGEWSVDYKQYELLEDGSPRGSKPASVLIGPYTQSGTAALGKLFDRETLKFPKPPELLSTLLSFDYQDAEWWVVDPFAGSGTTAHAVVDLNRNGGNRRFVMIEMGAHFHSALKPRIAKVLYSHDWSHARAQVHGKGQSALVKYFALESYEDALNNLPVPTGGLLANADPDTKDALITYSLDLELGPSLLKLDVFRDPWGYTINAQPAGEAEIKPHRVDLVETFNYLLGLKVRAYGPIERYAADFEQAEHAENLGRLKLAALEGRAGRLRLNKEGPFVFQRVEGELLDGTRVLVVWRKLTGNAEQDAAALEGWMNRHREETKERTEHRDYHLIYINGPVTLPQPTAEIRTVLPIEQTFKDRMFADTNGVQHG